MRGSLFYRVCTVLLGSGLGICLSICLSLGLSIGLSISLSGCDLMQSSSQGFTPADTRRSVCGNNQRQSGEKCDGDDMGDTTCESLGFTAGALGCKFNCQDFDRSACGAPVTCNNNTVDGNEVCDGDQLNDTSCQDLGLGAGQLRCFANCSDYDTSLCGAPLNCGNDNIEEETEICDGDNFGGATCLSFGFTGGDLACASDCRSIDKSSCRDDTPQCPEDRDCSGRVCGADPVCGESCGTCGSGTCSAAGQCLEEGCGTECSDLRYTACTCAGGDACGWAEDGVCDDECYSLFPDDHYDDHVDCGGSCTPTCGSRECGPDPSCGQSCGVCTSGTCNSQGHCVGSSSCSTAQNTLDIHVSSVTISGQLTLDGQAFPSDYSEEAYFYLVDSNSGDQLHLATSYNGSYQVQVVPGTYQVIYDYYEGDQIPKNNHAVLLNNVSINSSGNLDINVPSVAISGQLTLNGQAFPSDYSEEAYFNLVNSSAGDSVYLGVSYQGSYNIKVVAGTYDVMYDYYEGDAIPKNNNAKVLSGVAIHGSGNLDINVPAVSISGLFTHNGQSFPSDYSEEAYFNLVDNAEDSIYLGTSYNGSYSILVVPGVYHVVYDYYEGDQIPKNNNATLLSGVAVNSSGNLDIDVPSVQVQGSFTLNGQNFPSDYSEEAYFTMVSGNDSLYLGTSYNNSYSVHAVPGHYRVVYDYYEGSSIPKNNNATVINNVGVQSSGNLNINVEAVTVSGRFTHNNQDFPTAYSEEAYFTLTDDQDSMFLGTSYNRTYSVLVVPGTYNVMYDYYEGESIPKNNAYRLLSGVAINSNGNLDINVPSVVLAGHFLLNNQSFPSTYSEEAYFTFSSPDSGDNLYIATSYNNNYSIRMIPGTFNIIYDYYEGESIPKNNNAQLGCVTVQ